MRSTLLMSTYRELGFRASNIKVVTGPKILTGEIRPLRSEPPMSDMGISRQQPRGTGRRKIPPTCFRVRSRSAWRSLAVQPLWGWGLGENIFIGIAVCVVNRERIRDKFEPWQ